MREDPAISPERFVLVLFTTYFMPSPLRRICLTCCIDAAVRGEISKGNVVGSTNLTFPSLPSPPGPPLCITVVTRRCSRRDPFDLMTTRTVMRSLAGVLLIDAGCEWTNYASDSELSFSPSRGRWPHSTL